jgi:uncharacterized protein YacL
MVFLILFLLAISLVSSIVNFFSYLNEPVDEKNISNIIFLFVIGIVIGYLIFFN